MEEQNNNINNENETNENQDELIINDENEEIQQNENYLLSQILQNSSCILSKEKQEIADVTKDGIVDINDVMKLKRYIAAHNDENVAKIHPSWLNL